MEEKIISSEIELLSKAIDRITTSEVLESIIADRLPLTEEMADSNKIHNGKASILFVDMRDSTKLSERFSSEQLVVIYRSYIRSIVQAIRYSGGSVKDFMGDGVLAVFIDDSDGKSEDKAVWAARYITTVIDKVLNPVLDQKMHHRISCGIGIHTGQVSVSKVGMKGREQQEDAEPEYGLVWIGSSTNLACKMSSAVSNGTIFISSSTYSELTNSDEKQAWEEFQTSIGKNTLHGYVAKKHYLQLDQELTPCPATSDERPSLRKEICQEYKEQLALIAEKAQELGRKEEELAEKERKLNALSTSLHRQAQFQEEKTRLLNECQFSFFRKVIKSGHCKGAYVREMGVDFWEDSLESLLSSGAKIGMNEHEIKQAVSFAMVSIYQSLDQFDKAYDFLVEQATGYAWLHQFVVQDVVKKVGYCSRLIDAIDVRLAKKDLSEENQKDFERIKNWLVSQYRS